MRSTSAYRVFLTRNSEYHVQNHVCVGVRDRRTGSWSEDHAALGRALRSTVAAHGALQAMYIPCVGERLEFDVDGAALRTSVVLDIEDGDSRISMPKLPRERRPTSSARITR